MISCSQKSKNWKISKLDVDKFKIVKHWSGASRVPTLQFSTSVEHIAKMLVVDHKPSYDTSRLGIFKKFGRMIEDSKRNSAAKPDYPKKIRIIQKWQKRDFFDSFNFFVKNW